MEEPVCYANDTTFAVRLYLRDLTKNVFGLSVAETVAAIKSIVDDDPTSKWLVHNMLLLHLDCEELKGAKSKLENILLINLGWNPVTIEFYVEAVFGCHLHEYFLLMLCATNNFKLSQDCVAVAIWKIIKENAVLSKTEWRLYLSLIPRLGSGRCQSDGILLEMLGRLFTHFVRLPTEVMTTLNKIEILIQVCGLTILEPEDYMGKTEIADLIRDLKFDPTACMDVGSSYALKFFLDIFDETSVSIDIREFPKIPAIMELLGKTLVDMEFDLEDKLTQILMASPKEGPVKISKDKAMEIAYVGDCAFLTDLIIEKNIKYSSNCYSVEKISVVVKHLKQLRPRSQFEGCNVALMSFPVFCKLICSDGFDCQSRSQAIWFDRFCNYEEAFTTTIGCRLAEEVIAPKVGRATGLKMIEKILSMKLNEQLKRIITSVVFNTRRWAYELEKERKIDSAVLDLIFQKVISDRLASQDHEIQLNNVLAKLGSDTSFDKATMRISDEFVLKIWQLALQSPSITAEELLVRAVQLRHVGVDIIRTLQPFWTLRCREDTNENSGEEKIANNLFQQSFWRLFSRLVNEQPKNLYVKFMKFLPDLLRARIISNLHFEDLLIRFLRNCIIDGNCDKILTMVEIYQTFVQALLGDDFGRDRTELMASVYYHMKGVKESTYFAGYNMYLVRDKAVHILKSIRSCTNICRNTDENCLRGLSLVQLVLLYSRSLAWQETTGSYLKAPDFQQSFLDQLNLKSLCEIILSSSSFEWEGIVKILYEVVVMHHAEMLSHFLVLLRKVVLIDVPGKSTNLDESTKSRVKELQSPTLNFIQFGSYLVEVFTSQDIYNFKAYPQEHLKLFKTLQSVVYFFPDEPQYFAARRIALLALHKLVAWIVSIQANEQSLKKLRLASLALMKSQLGKLAPISQNIISILKENK